MLSLKQFHQCVDVFPEAILLLDTDGVILALNPAARHQLTAYAIEAGQTSLTDICSESQEQINRYLRYCKRTKSFVPGVLTLISREGESVAFRAEGALYGLQEGMTPSQLLLRLTPKHVAESRFTVLNQQIVKLSREIEGRRRAELELMAEHRRKDEFLAMLGHELRNPLAPISAALELLAMPNTADATRQYAQDILGRQVDHLIRLVDELLDVARISTGKITLKMEAVEVNSVVYRAIELCEPLISEKAHRFSTELAPEPLYVRGDLQRLTQVVGNVLNNAAKYTERGGAIRLTVRKIDDRVEILVKDNGMGIHPAIMPRIFDVFSQSERSLARSEGGLGVGLTVVRQLVEQHGGSVTAFSEGLERGSEFRISLPLAPEQPAQDLPAPSSLPEVTGAGRAILVVDDNHDAAIMLAELLRLFGNDVTVATNGSEAIAAATQAKPSVIFLDLGLPGMNGFAVAKELRSALDATRTTLIAVTGYGQQEDVRKTREAGFDHHLVKPVDINRINNILSSLPKR
ncbi:MAG TPA: ATP-binding protein [Paucimonas sp.]|nr:ATP-binding protein [Paucimonas sp.]